ncbi:MAG TPA: ABC transporter permease [Bryobacteraceae bacterium]|nr:ABC transporter permease [Bryobacteraceae bacterium]
MHDLRYAVRLIRQNWAFSLTVIVILALCIGANTAVLSIVNAAIVRPLPYPEPDRLAALARTYKNDHNLYSSVDGTDWEVIRDQANAVQAAAYPYRGSLGGGVNLGLDGRGVFIHQDRVSAGFFKVLGIPPLIGREFTLDEDREGGPRAAMLSYNAWQRFFHGDRAIIGREIHLRGEPYTVVGVMPKGFRFEVDTEVWTPLKPSTKGEGENSNYRMIARLRPGVSWEQARTQIAQLSDEVRRRKTYDNANFTLGLAGIQETITRDLRQPLMILWAAVGAVFVLGCVNIGGMLLARASGRVSEISTRLALGAPVRRIIRQLLTESLALGMIGGAAGAGVGWAGLLALRDLGAGTFSFLEQVDFDWRVLAATLMLTLIAGIGFGLVPAWQASRVDLRSVQTGSRTIAGRKRLLPLGTLVGGQVALTVPLLIGAGLLLHTFLHLWNVNPGFDPNHVMTARFSLQDARYGTSQKVGQLFDRAIERLRETPGIESAAASLALPYQRGLNAGVKLPGKDQFETTNSVYVTPGFFETLRIPLLEGRLFTAADGANSTKVVIVNEAFVSHYLKNQSVTGQVLGFDHDRLQIVGVVGSVEEHAGFGDFAPVAHVPTAYTLASQTSDDLLKILHGWFSPNWIVRSSIPDRRLSVAIEQAIQSVDPMLPISEFRSINDVKAQSLTLERFLAALVNALAVLAALLTTLGIYGLIANLVAERTKELGIRMALGSTAMQAMGVALKPALVRVLAGVVIGAAASIGLERLLKSFLWGVQPGDPITLLAVGVGLLLATVIAALAPSLRVIRLNPADTLRAE